MFSTRLRVPTWLLYLAAPLLLAVTLVSWGLSSAVGGSPDDDFHLASIWCGHGDNEPACAGADHPRERAVSSDLLVDSVCFAFNEDASAACQGEDFSDGVGDPVVTTRGNFENLYPPVFYWTMSWLAGDDIESSVLVMRAVNALLFTGLVTALFWLLPVHRRATLVWSLALTLVPLGVYLIPSTNPSSWAVLSAGTLWIALLGYFESSGRRKAALAGVAALSTLFGAGARADAGLFAIFAIVLVVVLTIRRTRRYATEAIVPIALAVIAALFALSAGQTGAASEGLAATSPHADVNPVTLAVANLVELPSLWVGVFGFWALGWLDTELPSGVWVPASAAFAGAVFLGLRMAVPRKGVVLALVCVALVAFPLILLVRSQSVVGANFQPRYLLPLMIILCGLLLLRQRDTRVEIPGAAVWVVVASLAFANAIALHTNIRRYVTGADVAAVNLDSGAEWWWDLPISPMSTWILGSLAFGGLLLIVRSAAWNSAAPILGPSKRESAVGLQ